MMKLLFASTAFALPKRKAASLNLITIMRLQLRAAGLPVYRQPAAIRLYALPAS